MKLQDSDITAEQQAAIDAVGQWYKLPKKDPKAKLFRLFGPAGTGKTSLAQFIVKSLNARAIYVTFTGKASLVLASKGCEHTSTIHRAIYTAEQDQYTGQYHYHLNLESELQNYDLVVLDEAPMVGVDLGTDLAMLAPRILALGDPYQLPPVDGESYVSHENPDFLLTEIHRQAADNPIIQMSMLVRTGQQLQIGSYGSSRVSRWRKVYDPEMLDNFDQALVGKNDTRNFVNQDYRRAKGLFAQYGPVPSEGEKLICLRNNYDRGFLNGQMFYVKSARRDGKDVLSVIVPEDRPDETTEILTRVEYFEGQEKWLDWRIRKSTDEFCYGRTITTHKAQGSQWPRVLVFNEAGVFKENWSRWLYTALTRASDEVEVLV